MNDFSSKFLWENPMLIMLKGGPHNGELFKIEQGNEKAMAAPDVICFDGALDDDPDVYVQHQYSECGVGRDPAGPPDGDLFCIFSYDGAFVKTRLITETRVEVQSSVSRVVKNEE